MTESLASSSHVLRFGVFQANLAARELRKHGLPVRLPGQPFCILSLLLEKPGAIVTREEMRQRLWPADTFVDFEHSLNTAVKKLRAALGDSPENPRYVETIPRVGYRFIAPLEELLLPAAPAAAATPGSRARDPSVPRQTAAQVWLSFGIAVGGLLLAATTIYLALRSRPQPKPSADPILLAVLPFENLTGEAAQDYFSDGLTEEMIAQLGQINPDHLRVIARTSVMHYKQSQEQLSQIGRELNVQYVLEGSVRRESGRVRITAQLVQVKDQTRVWSREYDRQPGDLLTLQGEVAQEVSDGLGVALGGAPKTIAAEKPAVSPTSYEAYDLYLRGRYFWNKRTKEDFERAADYFQQATAKDPNYARAYAGLADTYALMSSWSFVPQGEAVPKARAAALRALQIDPNLAEAHTSLALVAENYDYDWRTAEQEYRRAIQLDPGYPTAHQWYAECLSFQKRFDDALAESERARQIDPLSLIIATDRAAILYFARQYDRAIEQLRAVSAMDPGFQRAHLLAFALVEKGMFADARANAKEMRHSDGSAAWEVQAFIYAREGRKDEARRALRNWEESKGQRPVTAAVIAAYVALGRKDEAISLLQRAFAEHSNAVVEINVAPYYDPLRDDARFQELLRRVGLNGPAQP
ncbi:MAG TPA: tetratricopeptide repeat protein [Candidatus Acidoferrum sp.]|nr:tetratricopeptide repeat protein [Candidatus Acidoferrum sp.]